VASGIAAHREVGGDAAVYVNDPLRPDEWARALSEVAHDSRVADRLSRMGRDRASGITWDAIAEQMQTLARRAVGAEK
jgi:glycosyltransferase involved in cell wall biosynthesis